MQALKVFFRGIYAVAPFKIYWLLIGNTVGSSPQILLLEGKTVHISGRQNDFSSIVMKRGDASSINSFCFYCLGKPFQIIAVSMICMIYFR